MLYKLYIMKEKNLSKSYGENSWAIVTGATDGIGWGFCQILAKRGFNIFLISRTQEKIARRSADLLKQYPRIQVLGLAKDFSNANTIEFYQEIYQAISSLDVSIMVNNVGMESHLSEFKLDGDQNMIDCMNCNMMSMTILTKHFCEVFRQRKERLGLQKGGAIINVASILDSFPTIFPGFLYNATKVFDSYVSLMYEFANRDALDLLTLRPFFVSTGMTVNKQVDEFTTCSVEDCVLGALRGLGNVAETCGDRRHIVNGVLVELLLVLFGYQLLNWPFKFFFRNFFETKKFNESEWKITNQILNKPADYNLEKFFNDREKKNK